MKTFKNIREAKNRAQQAAIAISKKERGENVQTAIDKINASAQSRLDRRAAKHGLGSKERQDKIKKARDFFSKPPPSYSKDDLRKMGHPVE